MFIITPIRDDKNSVKKAILFIHGFAGKAGPTWGQFPELVGKLTTDCDIHSIQYPTTFKPDMLGAWAADPDIEELAKLVRTGMTQGELSHYTQIAVVAHSMGGLIVQRMILDYPDIAQRITHLIMFGTPNGGVSLANRFALFRKRPVVNMRVGSDFLQKLRADWSVNRPDHLQVASVAGANDRFVTDDSSHEGFPSGEQFMVSGDHISLVRPGSRDDLAVSLVVNQIKAGENQLTTASQGVGPVPTKDQLIAMSNQDANQFMVATLTNDLSGDRYVDMALRLEREGNPRKAVEVLKDFLADKAKRDDYTGFGRLTGVIGSLGGQLKRLWLRSQDGKPLVLPEGALSQLDQYPEIVMQCYTDGLFQSWLNEDFGQVYYHAINVAFSSLVWYKDHSLMARTAQKALTYAEQDDSDPRYLFWKYATIAEAHLYLRHLDQSVEAYRLAFEQEVPYNYDSTILQALTVIDALGEQKLISPDQVIALQAQLEKIFDPETLDAENQDVKLLLAGALPPAG